MTRGLAITLVVVACSAPLGAQRLDESRVAAVRSEAASMPSRSVGVRVAAPEPSTPDMVLGGLLVGAGGLVAGAMIGAKMEKCNGEYFCGWKGGLVGGIIGELIMLPIGVHTSSDHSTLRAKVLASLVVTAIGVAAAYPTRGLSLLFIPPAQLVATVAVEHKAAERSREVVK